jgi:hypothetical protein
LPEGLVGYRTLDLDFAALIELHNMECKNKGKQEKFEFLNNADYDEKIFEELLDCIEKKEKLELLEHFNRIDTKDKKTENKAKDKILGIIKQDFVLFSQCFPSLVSSSEPAMPRDDISSYKTLLRFINGGWLEDLALLALHRLSEEKDVCLSRDNICKNVIINYDKRTAELDIVVMRGYKLILITCTTENCIGVVKQKAFEALFRAEQLGGEHASVVVLSLLHKIHKNTDKTLGSLEQDLKQFNTKQKVKLLGYEDILGETRGEGKLQSAFRKIIKDH